MAGEMPDIGAVVQSKAGRDAGRYFVVIDIVDDQYVLICDGSLRKLARPKKKKLRHLAIKPVTIPSVRDQLAGGTLYDAHIRQNLGTLGYALKPDKAFEE